MIEGKKVLFILCWGVGVDSVWGREFAVKFIKGSSSGK